MKKVVINFSGHPLNNKAKEILLSNFDEIEDVKFGFIDIDNNILNFLEEIVSSIKTPLDGTVNVSILVPGYSAFAVMLFIYIEGIMGHYPNICILKQQSGGVYLPDLTFNTTSNDIRNAGRQIRLMIWK